MNTFADDATQLGPESARETGGVYERHLKRVCDAALAGLALVALSPLMAVIAVLVRLDLGAPVLFRQLRPGLGERPFELYKFRTMRDACDSAGRPFPDAERLTRLGQILRRSSLDELPELLNVVMGDMSLIGPRPLAMQYLPFYTAMERRRHTVRPGLTGLAQINGRNALQWEQRFAYDIEYVSRIGLRQDMMIMARTFLTLMKPSSVRVRGTGVIVDFDIHRRSQVQSFGPQPNLERDD